jgi:hypothetical protein
MQCGQHRSAAHCIMDRKAALTNCGYNSFTNLNFIWEVTHKLKGSNTQTHTEHCSNIHSLVEKEIVSDAVEFYTVMPLYPQVILSKTNNGYVKLRIVSNAIHNMIFM